MDADDLDEALSDLGVSSIHSSPPAEEMADGSSNANIGVVPLVASSANLNQVATNTNVPNGSAAVTIVAQGTTNPPARHTNKPSRRLFYLTVRAERRRMDDGWSSSRAQTNTCP